MFGIEHWGVNLDMMCVAKTMGNGLPIGAAITTSEISDKFGGSTISTFGGNPVCFVAALAVLDTLSEDLLDNVRKLSVHIEESLMELKEKCSCLGDIRGKGFMYGLEVVMDGKAPDAATATRIVGKCKDMGILIGKSGFYGNVLRFAPPLIADKEKIDYAISIVDKAVEMRD